MVGDLTTWQFGDRYRVPHFRNYLFELPRPAKAAAAREEQIARGAVDRSPIIIGQPYPPKGTRVLRDGAHPSGVAEYEHITG